MLTPPAVPRPAATVVLIRAAADGAGLEVLLTKRPSTMAFAPDVFVFPGGAVDPGDADARGAALRELVEEAGVTLEDPASLVPIARWVTPPFVERRFDVQFFAAELPVGVTPHFAPDEVVQHRWLTPRAALDAMAAGDLDLWVPTSTTLQQLEGVRRFGEIASSLSAGEADPIRIERVSPAIVRVVVCGAGAVPGQSVNTYLVGRRDLVVVDPGDPSEAAADALLAAAGEGSAAITGIVLTSAAPDHAAGAEALAGRLGIPVFGGPGAAHDLAFAVVKLADEEPVPAGDVELVAILSPGPRADAISLLAAKESAVFVGDLVGPGPSRSILPPSDAGRLAASRRRIEELRAQRVLTAHGREAAE